MPGPFPTGGWEIVCFTKLPLLHIWLVRACAAHKVNFTDNYNLIRECRAYKPKIAQTQMLVANLPHGASHLPRAFTTYSSDSKQRTLQSPRRGIVHTLRNKTEEMNELMARLGMHRASKKAQSLFFPGMP